MRLALSIWQDRLSPLFDAAQRLLLVDVRNGEVERHTEVPLDSSRGPGRVISVVENGADVLICGAISRPLHELLTVHGVRVWPFLTGPVEPILTAFLADRLSESQYCMPGCRRRRWQGVGNRDGRERLGCPRRRATAGSESSRRMAKGRETGGRETRGRVTGERVTRGRVRRGKDNS